MTRATTFDDSAFEAVVMRGLIAGPVWDSGAITYHLEYSDADGNGVDDWAQNGAAEAIRHAFQLWADVSGLTFTEVSTAAAANMVERTYSEGADSGSITLGRHFYPGQNDDALENGRQNSGEYNVNAAARWNAGSLQQGGSAFTTILHEIGHGIGLEHPHSGLSFLGVTDSQGDAGFFGLNQGIYTTMTYNDGWFDRGIGNQGTPMALDIAAVQAIYGANMSFATGNDTYALDGQSFYAAIWDAGGSDAIRYDGFGDARIFLDEATIDDTPTGGGLLSYVEGQAGGFTIAQGAVIENASGGSGDDLVVGNAGGNVLDGNAGADILVGLGGADVINGGDGADIIFGDYQSVADFGVALTPDPGPYEGPTLPDGLSLGSGTITVDAATGNTSLATAVDVSDAFLLQSSYFVQDREEFHTVSVDGTSGGGFAYFSFTLAETGRILLDLDGGDGASGTPGAFDSFLYLEDANGNVIDFNDDTAVDLGSYDSYGGGEGTYDSGLAATLEAGTYYIRLGQYESRDVGGEMAAGSTYLLHITADGYAFSGEPPTLPFDAFGQLGYYYETPDLSGAIGGYNAGGSNSATSKEGETGHEGHDHSRSCGCPACSSTDEATAPFGTGLPDDVAALVDWDAAAAAFGQTGGDDFGVALTSPSSFTDPGGPLGDLDGAIPDLLAASGILGDLS